jgi:hypothetical protein
MPNGPGASDTLLPHQLLAALGAQLNVAATQAPQQQAETASPQDVQRLLAECLQLFGQGQAAPPAAPNSQTALQHLLALQQAKQAQAAQAAAAQHQAAVHAAAQQQAQAQAAVQQQAQALLSSLLLQPQGAALAAAAAAQPTQHQYQPQPQPWQHAVDGLQQLFASMPQLPSRAPQQPQR